MNIGNELYLNVSRLARQSFLLFTEMPLNLNVLGTDYHFDYSTAIQGVSKKNFTVRKYLLNERACKICPNFQLACEVQHSLVHVALKLFDNLLFPE